MEGVEYWSEAGFETYHTKWKWHQRRRTVTWFAGIHLADGTYQFMAEGPTEEAVRQLVEEMTNG